MYLSDIRLSKGHTFVVTKLQFDQIEDNILYTSSLDGTIRIWDLNSRPFGIE